MKDTSRINLFLILSIICLTIFVFPPLLWSIPVQTEELRLPKPGELILGSEKDIPRHIWVAGQYLKSGKFNDVIAICEQVLGMKENNIEAHAHLAAAYKGLNEESKFKKEADLIKRLDPNSPALHLSLAKTYLYLKDFKKAEASYKEGIKITPGNTKFRMELGALYLEKGRLKEASEQFLKALKKKNLPMADFVNANFTLCKIDLMNKSYDEVKTRAKMMIDLYPPIEQSYNFLAYAYIGTGQPDKAIEAYKLLIKNNPDSAVPYQEIPLIYADKLSDMKNALDFAQKGAENFPENAKSQDVLGWILYKTRQFKKSVKSFEKARVLAPNDPFFIYHKGLALQGIGEKEKALSAFKNALELVDKKKQESFFLELRKRVEQSL